MTTSADDQPSLVDRLRYSAPRKPDPDAAPQFHYCTYCLRQVCLLPHEFRICQTRCCLELAIEDRKERLFQLQLSLPATHRDLFHSKIELQTTIAALEASEPGSLKLAQYKSVLAAVNADLGFYAKNECVDRTIALKEQIKELSKRLTRPSFSERFREEIWQRDKQTCYLCTMEIIHWSGDHMHIDHVKARSLGGSDEPHNLRIAHPKCNLRKADRALTQKRMKSILDELRNLKRDDNTSLF